MQSLSPNAQPVAIGKYQILEEIRHVDNLAYYKGKTLGVAGFEKLLLLCVVSPEASQDQLFVSNLLEETRKTVSLAHANIAQVYDLGHDDATGQYFLAAEYVPGHSLEEILSMAQRMGKPLPIDLAILIATEVAKGLDYVHRRKSYEFENLNIVHGDLRPSNIYISYDGTVKIGNFGTACATAMTKLEQDRWDASTISYFAPEVLKSEVFTQLGDIFSLGLVFYEMVKGSPPYTASAREAMYEQVSNASIPSLTRLGSFPREVVRIIESILVPNPDGRVDSAGTIFEELVGFIYSQNLKAEPRLLTKFLAEIGLSRHRTAPPISESQDRFAAFNLRRQTGRQMQPAIRAHVPFDPESDRLPRWLEYPLRDIVQKAPSNHWESALQIVLLVDEPEPHVERAADRWARLIEYYSKEGVALPTSSSDVNDLPKATLEDVIVVHTIFYTYSVINPASDLCEQFLYPMTLHIHAMQPNSDIDAPAYGFAKREFALDVLEQHGLDPRTLELLRQLWLTGSRIYEANPRILAYAISDAILYCVELLCSSSSPHSKRAIVWFASNIESLDALSIMVLARLSRAAQNYPVFTIMVTDDEALVYQTMARDQTFPDRLHTITVNYTIQEEETILFQDLDPRSRELLLLLSIWDQPIYFGELLQLSRLDRVTLQKLVNSLVAKRWLRSLEGNRLAIILPERLTHIFEFFSHEELAEAARRLRDWYCSNLVHPEGYQSNWYPMDVFWARIHAIAGEPGEVIRGSEFLGRSLESFGLYPILSHFYVMIDEMIVDSQINIPHYRNICLLRNAQLKLAMLDIETAQEQIYFLSYQTDQNQGDNVISNLLLFHGWISFMKDSSARALELFKQSADITKVRHNPRILALSHLFAAITYTRTGDLRDAIRLHRSSLSLLRYYGQEHFAPQDVAHILSYGVFLNYSYNIPRVAVDCLEELEILTHQSKDTMSMCYLLFARGIHYFSIGRIESAHATLRECCLFSSSYLLRFNTILALYALIHMCFLLKEYDTARDYLKRARVICSRAPETMVHTIGLDYRMLINLADPNYENDLGDVRAYFSSAYARAKKLNIYGDILRLRFISSFAPKVAVPLELAELPAVPDSYSEQLRLFTL